MIETAFRAIAKLPKYDFGKILGLENLCVYFLWNCIFYLVLVFDQF